MDISGEVAQLHLRTDANNLVTTAATTHLPEQRETMHMIQMLRKESCSGAIDDMAHVRTEVCLADCLTKKSAKPDVLIKAVGTGILPGVDVHPPFRDTLKHKAFVVSFLVKTLGYSTLDVAHCQFFGVYVECFPEYEAEEKCVCMSGSAFTAGLPGTTVITTDMQPPSSVIATDMQPPPSANTTDMQPPPSVSTDVSQHVHLRQAPKASTAISANNPHFLEALE